MEHNQSFQYIKDPFLFGNPNVVCRLSDVVMLFAPAVLVFNVSKFQVSPPRCFRVSSLLPYSPKVNQDYVCLLLYRGPQSKPRFYLFAMGKSGNISRLNDDAVIGQYDLIVERDVTERVSACERLRCSLRGRPHIPLQG